MKKNAIKEIEEEIDKKTKLPLELKNNLKKQVFINISIAIILIIYFIFLVAGSIGINKNIRTIDFNIFSIIFLASTIVLFEYSYKNKKTEFAIYGIEFLFIAIFTLFLPYIIFELKEPYKKYYLLINVYIAIYYSIKSIIIYIKGKNRYMNSISDVKEIVKKTDTKKKSIKVASEEKNKQGEKQESAPKKRGRPKKTEEKDKIESTPKKRGRPRKEKVKND